MNKGIIIQSLLTIVALFIFGCGVDSSKFNNQLKSRKLLDSGIVLNRTCDVLYYWSSEGRDGDYEFWVLYSKTPFVMPVVGNVKPDYKLSLSLINESIALSYSSKQKRIVNPSSCKKYDWNQNSANYRGFIIEADNGYFLYLERFGK